MAQSVLQIGVEVNQNRLFFILIFLCILNGCTKVSNATPSKNIISISSDGKLVGENNSVDTLLTINYSILGFKQEDLVKSKGFKKIIPFIEYNSDSDSLFYTVKYQLNVIMFSEVFNNGYSKIKDRNVIFNNKNCHVIRVIVKNSEESFDFTGFMSDYKDAEFYENNDYILIKSIPSHWTGIILSYFSFYQIIDKTKFVCYEIFMDISTL